MAKAQKGFDAIYQIDYDEAERTFRALKREYPGHPAPPLYLAVVVWLRELFGRQELNLDVFVAPGYFTKPTDRKMPQRQRQAFFSHLEDSQKLAQAILNKNPRHKDARYFMGSASGVLGSFAITIDRGLKQAFSHAKKAYKYHERLVAEDPQYHDAYMTVGLYEYIVDNLPWYIKWLAMLVGYRGSEERGFQYLTLASQKGRFVADDARTLLMVLCVHEGRNQAAFENARHLHEKFPRNFLLHLNQAQILEKLGRKEQAVQSYQEILRLAESRAPNYQLLPLDTFRYQIGRRFMELKHHALALEQFERATSDPTTPEREKALAHLSAGFILDLTGKRDQAIGHYQQVLRLREFEDSHDQAEKYLKKPYQG